MRKGQLSPAKSNSDTNYVTISLKGEIKMDQVLILEALIEVLKNQMVVIEQQTNNLKCCGNCKYYISHEECRPKHKHEHSPSSYCINWFPDGLTQLDR